MTVQERMDKEKIEVTCVDCGNVYRKNKYVAAKSKEQVCKSCNVKRMHKKIAGEVILAGARRIK